MSKTVLGVDDILRKMNRLKDLAPKNVADANAKSGEELIKISKILIPAVTGTNRALINGTANANGSYLCDFGPKAKVIEENRPFVNPALAVTRKRHKNRARRAMNKAVKEAFGG